MQRKENFSSFSATGRSRSTRNAKHSMGNVLFQLIPRRLLKHSSQANC